MDENDIFAAMDELTETYVQDERWDEDVSEAAKRAIDALGELTEELTGVEYVSGAWDEQEE